MFALMDVLLKIYAPLASVYRKHDLLYLS